MQLPQNKLNSSHNKRPFQQEHGFPAPTNFLPRNQMVVNIKKPRLNGGASSKQTYTKSPYELEKRKAQLEKDRRKLPIYPVRNAVVEQIKKHTTCIIIGETGSGKTTQIPQFLYSAALNQGKMISVTQPRRVGAVTLANRVAEEMGVDCGNKVGYSVRFESVVSPETVIHYQTDGMLLREAMIDPSLKRYSVIILDEAHERSLHTDVLFGIVKSAQKYRKKKAQNDKNSSFLPLKLIIMSATMDVDHFSKYFGNCQVLYVEGRQYPVEVLYTASQKSQDYFHNALVTIFQLHREKPINQHILVFLTGQEEIENMVRKIRDISKELSEKFGKIIPIGFFSAAAPQQQARVFEPAKPGYRKVVVATNIAETSLTIPEIGIVIDSGKIKSRVYKPGQRLDMLKVITVSKAQANQRTGRAGREAAGSCYRLYTEDQFDSMQDNTEPEITRCNLAGVVLELLSMGVRDILNFDFMDKPSPEALLAACRELYYLGAIDVQEDGDRAGTSSSGAGGKMNLQFLSENRLILTRLGSQLTPFPMDPKLAKILVRASELGCTEEALGIVSMMSQDHVLIQHAVDKKKCDEAHKKFMRPEGDHLMMLCLFRSFTKAAEVGKSRDWCLSNFVQERYMQVVQQIRKQLRDICISQGLAMKSCGQDFDLVRKALCAGLFMNAAELQEGHVYRIVEGNLNGKIHPSSCLMQTRPRTLIFSDLVFTNQVFCKDVTVVEKEWLLEVAPEYFRERHF